MVTGLSGGPADAPKEPNIRSSCNIGMQKYLEFEGVVMSDAKS